MPRPEKTSTEVRRDNKRQHQDDTEVGIFWQECQRSRHKNASNNNHKEVWNKWENKTKQNFSFSKPPQRYKTQNGNFTIKIKMKIYNKNRNENAIDGLKQQNAKDRGEKSVNIKIKYKLSTVNNRKKIHWKKYGKGFRDMWDYN